ncbi:MAG TPA: response regulator [Azospirillaceae bacterium]|nr:response regulator [Azospirillaceae bacterium]
MTSKTALVVEDDEGARYLLSKLLSGNGWNTVCVESGQACLDMLDEVTPDALLLDQRLPDMSGLEVANVIRSRGGDAPIVFVTAYVSAEFVRQVQEIRNARVLAKPFMPETFLTRLERCLPA